MAISARDIEKLQAIDYWLDEDAAVDEGHPGLIRRGGESFGPNGWQDAKVHAQSAAGTVETMAAKVRWLASGHKTVEIYLLASVPGPGWRCAVAADLGRGTTPEAAADALFWAVP